MLKQYLRDNHGNPKGVLLGNKDETGAIHIGWSLCSRRDHFNKHIGEEISQNRLAVSRKAIPASIKDDYSRFQARCQKYFKVTE